MFNRTLHAERPAIKLSRSSIGICAEIKQRISIPWLWAHHNYPGEPKPGAHCLSPFYADKNPGFWISKDGRRFFDYGEPVHRGDVINFEMLASGCGPRDAIRKLRELANLPRQEFSRSSRIPQRRPNEKKLRPLALDFLERGTTDDVKRLAELRCVSREAVKMAEDRGVLRFATMKDFRAWVVTDKIRCLAEARRLDGLPWAHIGSKKAWTLPGGNKKWPLGIVEAQNCERIALVEGGPDFLAAHHWLWVEERRDVAAVAVLGSMEIHPVALPLFAKKRVRIFPHYDVGRLKGFIAARRWADQLKSVGADVDWLDFSGLQRIDGHSVCDLNDLCRSGCDELETVGQIMP